MNCNEVLRRVRDLFEFSVPKLVAVFATGGLETTPQAVQAWLNSDEDAAQRTLEDRHLAIFLDGLIIDRRGPREGGKTQSETPLTNNGVLRKLKIALDYQASDMLAVLAHADVHISKHELSALFRKPTHKHYRACGDQLLHDFLNGLQRQLHGSADEAQVGEEVWRASVTP